MPVRYEDNVQPTPDDHARVSKLGRSRGSNKAGSPIDESVYSLTSTSDAAHPTEATYRLIARIFATPINAKYDLGQLRSNPNAKKLF